MIIQFSCFDPSTSLQYRWNSCWLVRLCWHVFAQVLRCLSALWAVSGALALFLAWKTSSGFNMEKSTAGRTKQKKETVELFIYMICHLRMSYLSWKPSQRYWFLTKATHNLSTSHLVFSKARLSFKVLRLLYSYMQLVQQKFLKADPNTLITKHESNDHPSTITNPNDSLLSSCDSQTLSPSLPLSLQRILGII